MSSQLSSPNFYENRILEKYAAYETKRVTLRQLAVFGKTLTDEKLVRSANYVKHELSVRLAHRIRDFQSLPYIVGTNPHIELIYNMYWNAFERFRTYPEIQTIEDNHRFCEMLQFMLDAHLVVIPQLALGIVESAGHMSRTEADRFMNEMLRSRIGRRVLAEQHIALSSAFEEHGATIEPHQIGIINSNCNAKETVERCSALAARIFRDGYGIEPPKVVMDGHVDATFTYIPDHIEYVIYELIKNSMQFTIAKHAPGGLPEPTPALPDIRVTVGQSYHDIVFRISDEGGGFDKDVYENLWSYSHASKRKFLNFDMMPKLAAKMDEPVPVTLHLGLGLPMSRVYANYWGGSINLQTMYGYGTDAYFRIGVGNQMEHLKFEEDSNVMSIGK
ncbi:branched-chain alpha-ketoacid dehydrogenase [Polychytrium aggregatum]|uniref:branched-chain alpha-ketoacid dehydrogenase n=1 Tax=Polychytrium aggregatum TaxID=110093 RepID=UPI0022FEB8A4|nr:branched-chain alpha-ketoacid dehydrogenase [Polychytrium aggregatum]KAI9205134.1 branched-chain alpha-ketoacid dehydrogenase [Polychytrium aggregatum]